MSLRSWGEGLVDLSECYFKYVKGYLVQRGYVYQLPKDITHPIPRRKTMKVPYPKDIDLIGIRPRTKEIALIECSERLDTEKLTKELVGRFGKHTAWSRKHFGRNARIMKYVTCHRASKLSASELNEKDITLITAGDMFRELLKRTSSERYRGEPILWILRTLTDDGFIQ